MRVAIALSVLVASTQACSAYRPLAAENPQPERSVRISSTVPFAVRLVGAPLDAPLCLATSVTGQVQVVEADTVRFARVTEVTPAPRSARCDRPGLAYLVLSEVEKAETKIQRPSIGRTVLFVGGVLGALFVLGAYVALCDADCP